MITNVTRKDKAFKVARVGELADMTDAQLKELGIPRRVLKDYKRSAWVATSGGRVAYSGNDKRGVMGQIAFGGE